MNYIRQQKAQKGYNPNTTHCIFTPDSDLVVLSLLTHEPHIYLMSCFKRDDYRLIYVSVLREYLQLEFESIKHKGKWSLERIINDLIFFTMFLGNDFIPPSLSIDVDTGGFDELIEFYKLQMPKMKDYIVNQGKVQWDIAQPFINWLAKKEQNQIAINLKVNKKDDHENENDFKEESKE